MDIFTISHWLAKLLLYLATTGVIGGIFVRWLTAEHATVLALVRPYLFFTALLGIASLLLSFTVQLLLFSGQGMASFYDFEMVCLLLSGNMGISLALAAIGFSCTLLTSRYYWQARFTLWVLCASVSSLLLSFVFTGHIVRTPWYGQLSLIVHVLALSCWLGALLPLWWINRLANMPLVAQVMTSFGNAALRFVSVLLIMGGVLLQLLLGDLRLLWQTDYGQSLLVKLSLVLLLLGLGAVNKLVLVPKLTMPGIRQRLNKVIGIEMLIGILVLAVTAWTTVVIGLQTNM